MYVGDSDLMAGCRVGDWEADGSEVGWGLGESDVSGLGVGCSVGETESEVGWGVGD